MFGEQVRMRHRAGKAHRQAHLAKQSLDQRTARCATMASNWEKPASAARFSRQLHASRSPLFLFFPFPNAHQTSAFEQSRNVCVQMSKRNLRPSARERRRVSRCCSVKRLHVACIFAASSILLRMQSTCVQLSKSSRPSVH